MKIHEIDQEIAKLVAQRLELMESKENCVAEVTRLAKQFSIPEPALKTIFHEIDSAFVVKKRPISVAFFGQEFSFTHQAAMSEFGSCVTYHPQDQIAKVFSAIENEEFDFGVVPVENSTEGAVNRTLDSLIETDTKIVGEISSRIHHNLLSNCDHKDIKNVYSHRQALAQCSGWLKTYLPQAQLIEAESTTAGAELAAKHPNSAAIASAKAAAQFGLAVTDKNIEDENNNTTRFSVISHRNLLPTGHDKTSLLLCTKDQAGALYESLGPFKRHGVSLTMIESRPSRRKEWEYFFFIDFIGHVDENRELLEELAEQCQFVKVLGSYPVASE